MTRFLPALLFMAALCVASLGSAESVGGGPRVTLTLAGSAGRARAFEAVARELLERLSIELRVERVARFDVSRIGSTSNLRSSEQVRVWLDFSEAARSTLYIHDIGRDRLLVRTIEHSGGMTEIAREELGHILQTSIEGLLAGAEIGLPRSEVLPPPAPPPADRAPARAEAERARPSWQLSAHYEAGLLSDEVLVTHGPVVALSLRGPIWGQRLGIFVSAQYRQPLHATANDLGARLEGAALRALTTIDLGLSPGVGLRLGAGGGADIVEVRPEAQGADSIELAEPKLVTVGVGRAVVGLEFRLSPSAVLWTQVVCDIDPTETRYVFQRSSGEQVVLYPFLVRPGLSLGLGFP